MLCLNQLEVFLRYIKQEIAGTALAAHTNGEEFQVFIEEGMHARILSWKIDVEEPHAASCISLSRNRGQAVAMAEHEWTALQQLNGLVIPATGEIAVLYERFLSRARDILGFESVNHPLFKHVILLAHKIGGRIGHTYQG